MLTHVFSTSLRDAAYQVHRNTIVLVGAGGNGAPMLMRLYKMHAALLALGRPGLVVHVYDPDTVSSANLGRQPFYPADVGRNKAQVLVQRLQLVDPSIADWKAFGASFPQQADSSYKTGLIAVITCVDTKAARRGIHDALANQVKPLYWLDMGNGESTGQVVLGECSRTNRRLRLPFVTELFPEMLDSSLPEDNTPSCSTAEALTKQDLMINETVVAHAAGLLWQGLFHGLITHPVIFVDTKTHQVTSMPIDKDFYKRRGHTTGRADNPQIVDM